MALFDKITKATQDAVRGAKDLTDVARLNSLISDEQNKINTLFNQIGKAYYDKHEEEISEPFAGMCTAIVESEQKIFGYNEEIKKIKGSKNCPKCGASNPINSVFCVSCGVPMNSQGEATPTAQKFCTSCGAAIEPGAAFCLSCGEKL